MIAILGEISFELLSGPRTIRKSYRSEYVAQQVIEDVPELQWVGNGLSAISVEMLFHRSFSNPNSQLNALLTASSDHRARPLIFGNGDLLGYFVITELTTTYEQLSAEGDLIAIGVQAELLERSLDRSRSETAPSRAFAPLAALMAPPGMDTGAISVPQAAGVGSEIVPSSQVYTPPRLPGAGGSLLLHLSTPRPLASSLLEPRDIVASQIVRAGN